MLDPKPRKRIRDPKAGTEKVLREKRCRACGRIPSGHPLDALNRAHIVPRSQGGDDVEENIMPLCGSGTSGCHGKAHARDRRVLELMRALMLPKELVYVLERKGEAWLDNNYPEGG